ncbi:MAG: ABC transporter permease, partial [Chloroflexota bacterium]|nr:ABC transporter permease [Chloroflexota bacterium]
MTQIFNAQLIAEAFGAGATVFILGGLGYMFTDRAGVFNITVEGLLLFSAFFAAVGSGTFHSSVAGVVAGITASLIVSIIFFAVSIGLRADIIIVGIAINLLASGTTVFLLSHIYGNEGFYQPLGLPTVPAFSIPLLSSLPLLGPTFSNGNLLTYIAWAMVPLSQVLLYRTPLGLRIRAVGESPEAAATVGINVRRTQFIAIMLCGVLCGLGGCYLSIGPLGGFNRDMSAGQGWIALAAETLGNGTPLGTFVSCVFFGAAQGVSSNMQAAGIGASQFAHSIPYVVTIIGLALAARRAMRRRSIRGGTVGPAEPETSATEPAGVQPAMGG